MKRKTAVSIIVIVLLLSSVTFAAAEGGSIKSAGIGASPAMQGSDISLYFSLEAPEGKEFSSVQYNVKRGEGFDMEYVASIDNKTALSLDYVHTEKGSWPGSWYISLIKIYFTDGTSEFVYDPADINPEVYTGFDEYTSYSFPRMSVLENPDIDTSNTLTFDPSTVKMTPRNPKLWDTVSFSVSAGGNAEIKTCNMGYDYTGVGVSPNFESTFYNSASKTIEISLPVKYTAKYRIAWFYIEDEYGNSAILINSAYPDAETILNNYPEAKVFREDLSDLSFEITDKDTEAPSIDIDAIRFDEDRTVGIYEKYGNHAFSVKASDDTGITMLRTLFVCSNQKIPTIFEINYLEENIGEFSIPYSGQVYGRHELACIWAEDSANNISLYVDPRFDYLLTQGSEVYGLTDDPVLTDLSDYYFEVVARDEETGISAFNETMQLDAQIHVIKKSQTGEDYKKLHDASNRNLGFYDITMTGHYNDDEHKTVRLDFPLDEPEGTVVLIKHLLHDGKVQVERTSVCSGLVSIYVDSFSPFTLETTGQTVPNSDDGSSPKKSDTIIADGNVNIKNPGQKRPTAQKDAKAAQGSKKSLSAVIYIASALLIAGGTAFIIIKKKAAKKQEQNPDTKNIRKNE